MVAVVAFEFSVMRCQPLRRALCVFLKNFDSSALIIPT
ncbi:acetyltransferase [Vibrio cholerae]|nr:acetyltransferase [Vibrio cholerae]MBO1386839.1 acetyltransferase [Vibrio cholerae]